MFVMLLWDSIHAKKAHSTILMQLTTVACLIKGCMSLLVCEV